MAEENLLRLFDLFWFEQNLFTSTPSFPSSYTVETPTIILPSATPSESDLDFESPSQMPTFYIRSPSDQFSSVNSEILSDLSSPSSVLHSPRTLTSRPSNDASDEFFGSDGNEQSPNGKNSIEVKNMRNGGGGGICKRLFELEFEELKGFMDLGFVFSEEDRDSSLVSIIPGLQRFGRSAEAEDENKALEKEGKIEDESVTRPYLSEAWDALDWRKVRSPLMKWTIPSPGNEIDMKDHLRFWAHTVASTVR